MHAHRHHHTLSHRTTIDLYFILFQCFYFFFSFFSIIEIDACFCKIVHHREEIKKKKDNKNKQTNKIEIKYQIYFFQLLFIFSISSGVFLISISINGTALFCLSFPSKTLFSILFSIFLFLKIILFYNYFFFYLQLNDHMNQHTHNNLILNNLNFFCYTILFFASLLLF